MQLRHWRSVRGKSQLQLAIDTGISVRQISFIETGRSRPRRDTLVRIANALDVPFRDRNSLVEAAGYAREYTDSHLSDRDSAGAWAIVRFLLEAQSPYSSVAVDRAWNVVETNRTWDRLASLLSPDIRTPPVNLLRVILDPGGLLPYLLNAEQVASALSARVRRENAAWGTPGDATDTLDELLDRAGLEAGAVDAGSPPFVIPYHLRVGEQEKRLFSTSLLLGAPADITLQEIRIESFFPLDDALAWERSSA